MAANTGATVNFDYYTVTFGTVNYPSNKPADASKTATITAKVGANAITSGTKVYTGTAVDFTVAGEALTDYDYSVSAWGVATAGGGDKTTASHTYSAKANEVTVTLTRNTYTVSGLAGAGSSAYQLTGGVALDGAAVSTLTGTGTLSLIHISEPTRP